MPPSGPDFLIKEEARALEAFLAERGFVLKHMQALEAMARVYGYASWHLLQHAAQTGSEIMRLSSRIQNDVQLNTCLSRLGEFLRGLGCPLSKDSLAASIGYLFAASSTVTRSAHETGLIRSRSAQPEEETMNTVESEVKSFDVGLRFTFRKAECLTVFREAIERIHSSWVEEEREALVQDALMKDLDRHLQGLAAKLSAIDSDVVSQLEALVPRLRQTRVRVPAPSSLQTFDQKVLGASYLYWKYGWDVVGAGGLSMTALDKFAGKQYNLQLDMGVYGLESSTECPYCDAPAKLLMESISGRRGSIKGRISLTCSSCGHRESSGNEKGPLDVLTGNVAACPCLHCRTELQEIVNTMVGPSTTILDDLESFVVHQSTQLNEENWLDSDIKAKVSRKRLDLAMERFLENTLAGHYKNLYLRIKVAIEGKYRHPFDWDDVFYAFVDALHEQGLVGAYLEPRINYSDPDLLRDYLWSDGLFVSLKMDSQSQLDYESYLQIVELGLVDGDLKAGVRFLNALAHLYVFTHYFKLPVVLTVFEERLPSGHS